MQPEGLVNIGKRDVYWNYLATFFQIGAGVILLPFILKMLPSETVGIWTIFQTVTSLAALLDFGFLQSFSRNVSYVFAGVRELKKTGVGSFDEDAKVNYGLLKATIVSMRRFYSRMALIVFVLLLIFGTLYFYRVLQSYNGDRQDAFIAWGVLICINSYNLYTLYYDALLLGKGCIRRSKQINIVGQSVYLLLAVVLIYAGFGLVAIVSAQLVSFLIRRTLSYKVFFTKDLKEKLSSATDLNSKEVFRVIIPNAVKVGLTQLGGFLVMKSAVFIGALYLTLNEIAEYGITIQVIGILSSLSMVFYQSYLPKLAECRVKCDLCRLKYLYIRSVVMLVIVFVVGGVAFIFLGDWALDLIGSETRFLPTSMLVVALFIALLEKNHALAAGFLVAKNEVPFFKASLLSGAATVLLLWFMLGPLHWGVWGMVLAQGISQLVYQNWKWPLVLIRELKGDELRGNNR